LIVNENEKAELMSRRWRAARNGSGIYPERFDGRRFDGLAKLVASVARKSLERQLARREWSIDERAA
jgi:hypothetical protein